MPQQNKAPLPDNGQGPEAGASSENQELYDIFVSQGFKIASSLAKSMQGKTSPESLGTTLLDIVKKVENEGKRNGIEFPKSIVLQGATEIMQHLVAVSGVEIDKEQIGAAVGIAVGKYVKNALKTGEMTQEDFVALTKQVQEGYGVPPPQAGEVASQPHGGGIAPPNSGILGGVTNGP